MNTRYVIFDFVEINISILKINRWRCVISIFVHQSLRVPLRSDFLFPSNRSQRHWINELLIREVKHYKRYKIHLVSDDPDVGRTLLQLSNWTLVGRMHAYLEERCPRSHRYTDSWIYDECSRFPLRSIMHRVTLRLQFTIDRILGPFGSPSGNNLKYIYRFITLAEKSGRKGNMTAKSEK